MQKSVLLTGTIDAVGQTRLPRLFHDAGCAITLLAPSHTAIWKTRYAGRRLPLSPEPVSAVQTLQRHLEANQYDAVIVLDEPFLWALTEAPQTDWLYPWFPVNLKNRAALWTAFSKVAFVIACSDAGSNIPDFFFVEDADGAVKTARDHFEYPVVLKSEHGLAGSGVRIAGSERELREQFAEISDGSAVVLQRFIKGPVGTCPVLFDHGKPVCWFAAYTKEHWPTPWSASSAVQIVHRPDLQQQLEAVGAATGFHGLAGVDWVEDPQTGEIFLIELNPRPTPATYLGTVAGVDFAGALTQWFAGTCTEQVPAASADGHMARMFPQNLYYSFDNRRLSSVPRVLADAPWSEPALVAAHLRRTVSHFLPAPVRALGRRLAGRAVQPK